MTQGFHAFRKGRSNFFIGRISPNTMRIVKQTHIHLHNYFLNQSLKKIVVDRKPTDYSAAKSIGILFDSTDLDERQTVLKFADKLKGDGKKVSLMAYFDDRKPHNEFHFKYFTKNEVDWLFRPKSDAIEDFIQSEFDIFFNLNLKPNLSLEYLSALSKAHLRVGPATNKTYCYDLMIDSKNESNLNQFIRDIEFYLQRLNSRKHEYSTA